MTRIYSHLVHGHARDFYRFIFCQSQYSPQPAVMQGQTLGSLIAFDTYLPTYLGYIMIVSVCRLGRTFASCRERSLTSFDWIGLSCFAYIEFDRDLQVWSNPNRRSAVRWYFPLWSKLVFSEPYLSTRWPPEFTDSINQDPGSLLIFCKGTIVYESLSLDRRRCKHVLPLPPSQTWKEKVSFEQRDQIGRFLIVVDQICSQKYPKYFMTFWAFLKYITF